MVLGLILGIVVSAIALGLTFFLKTKLTGGVAKALSDGEAQVRKIHTDFEGMLTGVEELVSKAQLENIQKLHEAAQVAFDAQKKLLKEIEDRLGKAQKDIEVKEAHHQDVKTSKAEDEAKLQALLQRYQALSSEAVSLEQELATSLKDLDSLMSSIPMTDSQKAAFALLSESLTESGSRLRDLLTEYKTVNERLEGLQAQLLDLETEYTRLIEQQLGE